MATGRRIRTNTWRNLEKTNIKQQTFLSVECVDELKIYMQSRGFPKEGALFISVHNKRLTSRDINNILKAVVEKTFKHRANEWKTKNLRDSFMNALVRAKIPTEIKSCMVGHIRPNAQKSYDMTEETLRPLYEDAFKFLTINGFGQTSRKIEELEKAFKQKTEEQSREIETLRSILVSVISREKLEMMILQNLRGKTTQEKEKDEILSSLDENQYAPLKTLSNKELLELYEKTL